MNLSRPTGAKQILTMAALGLWHAVAERTQQGVMQLQSLCECSHKELEVMYITLEFDRHAVVVSVFVCALGRESQRTEMLMRSDFSLIANFWLQTKVFSKANVFAVSQPSGEQEDRLGGELHQS